MPVHHQAQGAGDVTVHKIENMGSLGNNGYIVICPETNQAVCIDTPDEPEKMINEVRESGVDVQAILVTHGHGDHLAGYNEITGSIGAPAAIGELDAHLPPGPVQRQLNDGDTVPFGNRTIQCIHTPGHTDGSTCYVVGGFLFSGDTLFPGGPGRSRSPEALEQLLNSINSKLLTLPARYLRVSRPRPREHHHRRGQAPLRRLHVQVAPGRLAGRRGLAEHVAALRFHFHRHSRESGKSM